MRPALFLDRDGVINVEKKYVHRIADFEFVDGIFELCRRAEAGGMAIVVVTNQAGIGRGYYTERQFHELTKWMVECFADDGVSIDAVYFCPFHPEHGVGVYRRESFDRKPNPGMILRAKDALSLDLSGSILVGDKISDIVAAKDAGVGCAVLMGDGEDIAQHSCEPDMTIVSLREVWPLIDRYRVPE